jgi:polyisoprenoid-binding protein YceI
MIPTQEISAPENLAAQQAVREQAAALTAPTVATGQMQEANQSYEKLAESADRMAKLADLIDSARAERTANQPLQQSPEQGRRDRAAAPLATTGATQQVDFGLDLSILEKLTASLDQFNKDFSTNIDKLNQSQIQITLDATNVNVNLNGADVLSKLTDSVQQTIMDTVTSELGKYKVINGRLTKDTGVLGK